MIRRNLVVTGLPGNEERRFYVPFSEEGYGAGGMADAICNFVDMCRIHGWNPTILCIEEADSEKPWQLIQNPDVLREAREILKQAMKGESIVGTGH